MVKMALKRGDWHCPECSMHNFARRTSCYKCHTDNPSPSTVSEDQLGKEYHSSGFKRGDWACPTPDCNAMNFASRSECYECSTAKPEQKDEWKCECGYMNKNFRSACFKCAVGNPGEIMTREGDWFCGACEHLNFARRTECQKCEAYRN